LLFEPILCRKVEKLQFWHLKGHQREMVFWLNETYLG
jgi:hypothetical protein